MNRNDLEKMFDNQDFIDYTNKNGEISLDKVKGYIFETMIPKVLEDAYSAGYNKGLQIIKNKLK